MERRDRVEDVVAVVELDERVRRLGTEHVDAARPAHGAHYDRREGCVRVHRRLEGRQVAARAVVVAHAHRLVRVDVVEADRVVVGARGQRFAVGRPAEAVHGLGVLVGPDLRRLLGLELAHVPDDDRAVVRRRREVELVAGPHADVGRFPPMSINNELLRGRGPGAGVEARDAAALVRAPDDVALEAEVREVVDVVIIIIGDDRRDQGRVVQRALAHERVVAARNHGTAVPVQRRHRPAMSPTERPAALLGVRLVDVPEPELAVHVARRDQ